MGRRSAAIVVVCASLMAAGCIDDLPQAQVVVDTRVIAARMEVDGAPERAWPRLDETGVVTWRLVDPTDSPAAGWAFLVCPAAVTPSGLTVCVGPPLDVAIQMEPSGEAPSFPVSFPAAALGDVEDVLVQGIFCPDGSPEIDLENQDVSCVDGTDPGQLANYTIHIERDGVGNLNPTIPVDGLTFAGNPWNESATVPPETGCRDMAGTAELPLASRATPGTTGNNTRGDEVGQEIITITGDPNDREEFVSGERNLREDLIFAHYSNVGEPTRLFSVNDDFESTAEVKWSYPTSGDLPTIDDTGVLVRWWIVLIDQRGGTHWTERFVCLVP